MEKAYPSLIPHQYYILAMLCGFFILEYTLYGSVFVLFLFFYSYKQPYTSLCYLVLSIIIGITLFLSLYYPQPAPSWYSPTSTYLIEGYIHDVRYSSNNKVQIIIKDITARASVDIQRISRTQACRVQENGHVLYTTARRCAVAYPIQEHGTLPYYAIYTPRESLPTLYRGQYITGVFSLENIHSYENGGFSLARYYKKQHIAYRARLQHLDTFTVEERNNFLSYSNQFTHARFELVLSLLSQESSYSQDSLALIYALIFGSKYHLSREVETALIDAGLLHSIVLSGLHISSLFIFVFPLIWSFENVTRFLYHIPRFTIQMALLIFFALIYAVIASFPLSYMRALTMLIISFLLTYTYRRYTLLDILLYALFAIFIVYPEKLFTLSLQLSCSALFAIYLSIPLIRSALRLLYQYIHSPYLQYLTKLIVSIALVTLSINIVLLPLLIHTFGTFSFFFFLNILWIPIVSIFVVPFLLCAFFLALFNIYISIIWEVPLYCIEVLLKVLSYMRSEGYLTSAIYMRPHSYTHIAFYLALFTFMIMYNRQYSKRILYSLCFITIVFFSYPIFLRVYRYIDTTLYLHVLDVGKGQSVLIEHRNKRFLIDTGEGNKYFDAGKSIISPLLTYNNAPHIDGIIFTHQDNDHIGGSLYLSRYYTIDAVYYNGDSKKNTTTQALFSNYQDIHILSEGDSIQITPEVSLFILFPHKQLPKKTSSNGRSIVAMLQYQGNNIALLSGDIDIAGQKHLVTKYATQLQAPVLILPHHGSRYNIYEELYSAVQPTYAIASTQREDNNFFSPYMQSLLQDTYKIQAYSTCRYGKITYRYTKQRDGITLTKK